MHDPAVDLILKFPPHQRPSAPPVNRVTGLARTVNMVTSRPVFICQNLPQSKGAITKTPQNRNAKTGSQWPFVKTQPDPAFTPAHRHFRWSLGPLLRYLSPLYCSGAAGQDI